MKKKQQFERPAILQEFTLLPEAPILAESVVDDVTVISEGQQVQDIDASDQGWNHQWEW